MQSNEHISAYLHLKGFYWLLFELVLSGLFLCFPSTRRHWNWIFHLQNMLCSHFLGLSSSKAFVSRFIFCYPPFFFCLAICPIWEKHSNRLHDNPECWMYDHVVSNCHMAKIDHNLKRFWNRPGCVREQCSLRMIWSRVQFGWLATKKTPTRLVPSKLQQASKLKASQLEADETSNAPTFCELSRLDLHLIISENGEGKTKQREISIAKDYVNVHFRVALPFDGHS